MMEINFSSDKITYETCSEEGYYMIGFSDNGDEPNQYVLLQKSIEFDAQDIELDLNTYYFEYSDQSYSGYGICEKIVVEKGEIVFSLKENILGDITKIIVLFEVEIIQDWAEFEVVFKKIINNGQLYWKV